MLVGAKVFAARLAVCAIGFATMACNSESEADTTIAEPDPLGGVHTNRTATAAEYTAPANRPVADQSVSSARKPDYVADNGLRYTWVRTIVPASINTDIGGGEEEAKRYRGQKKIADMSVPELAAKLRPRLFVGTEEYILDHDPIEMAERVKANVFQSTSGYRPDFARLVSPGPEAKPEFIIPVPFDGPNAPDDDRVSYDHAGVSWPAMTSLKIENIVCTANIIGSRVASTAAHCFGDRDQFYAAV